MSEPTEWISVERTAKGETTVKVTLVDGHLAAKWAERTHGQGIKESVAGARRQADKILNDLKGAVGE